MSNLACEALRALDSNPRAGTLDTLALDRVHLEACLARDVRAYLATRDPELISNLSSDLEYLLTCLWHDRGLPRWAGFDGLWGCRPTILELDKVRLVGLMSWGDRGDISECIEVFRADLAPNDYVLRFGRRGQEGRHLGLDSERSLWREIDSMADEDWAYVFRPPSGG